jgi:hypothetical protein
VSGALSIERPPQRFRTCPRFGDARDTRQQKNGRLILLPISPAEVQYTLEALMIQTVEAVIDTTGHVRLLGKVRVDAPCRALVTVLEEPAAMSEETALLAEPALAEDWSRPEEDSAWSHLQPAK